MTTAERIVGEMNAYEHRCATHEDSWGSYPWDEVKRLAAADIDRGATQASDEYGCAFVAIFNDGSAVVRREDERRWVAMVPASWRNGSN